MALYQAHTPDIPLQPFPPPAPCPGPFTLVIGAGEGGRSCVFCRPRNVLLNMPVVCGHFPAQHSMDSVVFPECQAQLPGFRCKPHRWQLCASASPLDFLLYFSVLVKVMIKINCQLTEWGFNERILQKSYECFCESSKYLLFPLQLYVILLKIQKTKLTGLGALAQWYSVIL